MLFNTVNQKPQWEYFKISDSTKVSSFYVLNTFVFQDKFSTCFPE